MTLAIEFIYIMIFYSSCILDIFLLSILYYFCIIYFDIFNICVNNIYVCY